MFALQCFGTGVFVCFALGGPKLEFGKVWCGCLGTNAQTWIIESFHPWALESLNAWILESLNAWVLESLNPGGFESLTLWILGSRCGNLISSFLEVWINILWRKLSCIVSSVAVYAHILAQAPWAYRLRSLANAIALVVGVWNKSGRLQNVGLPAEGLH